MTDGPAGTGDVECVGRRWPLFRLALAASVLTILTLGVYRFWMKSRLRRYYWSSFRVAGSPVEYVGEPLEKLLGFLIAVVFLAFYLGIVNLVLVFASFSLFQTNGVAYLLSFLGVVPLWFYAAYRARRYVLARTRWLGIRFGLAPGAAGYAWRAVGHWLAVILTLGLAWPRMTFWLEKYRTDRTTFGTLTLHQGGNVAMLYQVFVHLMIGVIFSALTIAIALANDNERFLWLLIVFLPWAVYGLVHYRVHAFRRLTDAKSAGGLSLVSRARVVRVARIWLLGGSLALVLPFVVMSLAAYVVISGATTDGAYPSEALRVLLGDVLPGWAIVALGVVLYFGVFVTFGVLRHVFITLPLWRHYGETLTLVGTSTLPRVAQQGRDAFEEAEGIAEALDVGAAI
ncbi:DUF898 domain-containing protein [Oceaniglobus trochenteri]|uniref:DUF898 domain-containing protein n=1 Tax=Oceaniglobus trochenteri TaxID=2763260 RepID=UPI001CFF625B|nr:DUF898 domain-containing protein [Oceaniglobus trochenteri]